jgi:GNAT superfamily N-acetyltransferase
LARRGAQQITSSFESHPLSLLPGVPTETEAYSFFLNRGWRSYHNGVLLLMGQETSRFRFPPALRRRIQKLAAEGVRLGRMKPEERAATERFLAASFPEWHHGIAAALERGEPLLVAVQQGRVLGFSGPFRVRRSSGLGGFHAVGVAPAAQGRGLGAALFNLMSAELKRLGAKRVMLTTGLSNPAQEIYIRAGYRTEYIVDYQMRKKIAAETAGAAARGTTKK